jgi:hypothetical protein
MIEITVVGLAELEEKFDNYPERLHNAILLEMKTLVEMGISATVRDKLSGDPLHHRTGNLIQAVEGSGGVEEDGSIITGFWGVTRQAPYGELHEKGGTVEVREHLSHSRLGKEFTVGAHNATYPQRAFLAPTLLALEPTIRDRLQAAALLGFEG